PDQSLVVVDDLADAEPRQRRGIGADLLDRAVLAGPRRRQAAIALRLEERHESFPAERRDPGPVDEQDCPRHSSAASVSRATTSTCRPKAASSTSGRRIVAVEPKPTIRWVRARMRIASTAVSTDRPSGSGIATQTPWEASMASRSNAMYRPSQRSPTACAQASSAARPAEPASIPAPNWATGEAAS